MPKHYSSTNLWPLLGYKNSFLFPRAYWSASSALLNEEVRDRCTTGSLRAVEDQHGGVIVNIEEPMDSFDFASMLEASLSQWRMQVDFKVIIILQIKKNWNQISLQLYIMWLFIFVTKVLECCFLGKEGSVDQIA